METHQGIFLCCINQHYIYICSAVTGESRPKIDRFVSVGRFVSVRVARTFLVACTFASLVCSMASKVVRIWLPASCIHMYVLICADLANGRSFFVLPGQQPVSHPSASVNHSTVRIASHLQATIILPLFSSFNLRKGWLGWEMHAFL